MEDGASAWLGVEDRAQNREPGAPVSVGARSRVDQHSATCWALSETNQAGPSRSYTCTSDTWAECENEQGLR